MTSPNPVLRVFVSSTMTDLVDIRSAAFQVVLSAGHLPLAAEYFTPTGQPSLDIIDAALSASDVVLLIVADFPGSSVERSAFNQERFASLVDGLELQELLTICRRARHLKAKTLNKHLEEHGFKSYKDAWKAAKKLKSWPKDQPPPRHLRALRSFSLECLLSEGMSYTDYEHRRAQCMRKVVIPLVLDESSFPPASLALLEESQSFQLFRKRVLGGALAVLTDNLSASLAKIAIALNHTVSKEDGGKSKGLLPLGEVLGAVWANPVAKGVVDELKTYQKLYARHGHNTELKAALARFVCNVIGPCLIKQQAPELAPAPPEVSKSKVDAQLHLFLESGSTCLHLAECLQRSLIGKWVKVNLLTNNVLAYMHLKLKGKYIAEQLKVDMVPGWPEGKWGATYSDITHTANLETSSSSGSLSEEAELAIAKVSSLVRGKTGSKPRLVLAATSGLTTETFERPQDDDANGVHLGPHVGSYHNALFKRALLDTKLPVLWLLDATKLSIPFDGGRCSSVARNDAEWVTYCNSGNQAIMISYYDASKVRFDAAQGHASSGERGILSAKQLHALSLEFAKAWGLAVGRYGISPSQEFADEGIRLMLFAGAKFVEQHGLQDLLRVKQSLA